MQNSECVDEQADNNGCNKEKDTEEDRKQHEESHPFCLDVLHFEEAANELCRK